MAKNEIQFRIEGTTPHTLPMERLAEYLKALASVLGSKKHVHFLRVEKGSALNVIEIDEQEIERVFTRAKRAATGRGSKEAVKASSSLHSMLRQDHHSAELVSEEGDLLLSYSIAKDGKEKPIGPIWQDGSLDGLVVKLGGLDETLPVHLVYEQSHYICNATRDIVRDLGQYIWRSPIRVHGRGKWSRNTEGKWELEWFDIQSFEPLEDVSLSDTVGKLRAIPNNDIFSLKDPLAEMQKIRGG